MEKFLKLLENKFYYIGYGVAFIALITGIFIGIALLRSENKSIISLLMTGKYQECYDMIQKIKKRSLGYRKQWVIYHEAMIYIANEEYQKALDTYEKIKNKSLNESKLFWISFIYLNLNRTNEAIIYFSKYNNFSKTHANNIKVLDFLIKITQDNTISYDDKIFSLIKNPLIIKYITKIKLSNK